VLVESPVLRLLELPLVLLLDRFEVLEPADELLVPLWLLLPDWLPPWSDFAIAKWLCSPGSIFAAKALKSGSVPVADSFSNNCIVFR